MDLGRIVVTGGGIGHACVPGDDGTVAVVAPFRPARAMSPLRWYLRIRTRSPSAVRHARSVEAARARKSNPRPEKKPSTAAAIASSWRARRGNIVGVKSLRAGAKLTTGSSELGRIRSPPAGAVPGLLRDFSDAAGPPTPFPSPSITGAIGSSEAGAIRHQQSNSAERIRAAIHPSRSPTKYTGLCGQPACKGSDKKQFEASLQNNYPRRIK